MADKGTPEDGPSLEMPSLSLRRRRRRGALEEDGSSEDAPEAPAAAAPTSAPSQPPPAPAPTRSAPLPSPEPQRPEPVAMTQPLPAATPAQAPGPEIQAETEPAPRRRPSLPGLTGVTAALATGAVVGALTVLLVWLASMGCEAARGTASCGGGPGFLVLVAVLAAGAYAGSALLGAFGQPDAGSTSLLAVGVMAVLVLVFFTDALFEPWMALAVPVVSALAYAVAWWVSAQVVQPDDDRSPSRR